VKTQLSGVSGVLSKPVLFNLFVIVEPLLYFRICLGNLIEKKTNYL